MLDLDDLQRHTIGRTLVLPTSARELWGDLRRTLLNASNQSRVLTSPSDIYKNVLLLAEPPPSVLRSLQARNLHVGAYCIVGGDKNQARDPAIPHLKRHDGAWFDFSITVRERDRGLELLAYDFEIRLLPGMGTSFLRFDLNLPDHRNQARELRCHMHPGCDDLLLPAPLMTPSEVLGLFIDGARLPADRDPRAPTAFEVGWLRQSLEQAPAPPGEAAP